jgi:hypothetical protein
MPTEEESPPTATEFGSRASGNTFNEATPISTCSLWPFETPGQSVISSRYTRAMRQSESSLSVYHEGRELTLAHSFTLSLPVHTPQIFLQLLKGYMFRL